MSKKSDYIVGLDIGTTKICCIIGEVTSENEIDIIGMGQSPSRGLRKGVVVNIDSTVESIKTAVEEAELMAVLRVYLVTPARRSRFSGSAIRDSQRIGIAIAPRWAPSIAPTSPPRSEHVPPRLTA